MMDVPRWFVALFLVAPLVSFGPTLVGGLRKHRLFWWIAGSNVVVSAVVLTRHALTTQRSTWQWAVPLWLGLLVWSLWPGMGRRARGSKAAVLVAMATETPVLYDEARAAAYYLAFDLILLCAPVEDGRVVTGASKSVSTGTGDFAEDAWNAAIRVELLKAFGSETRRWESVIAEAEADAQRAARAAELAAPPGLDGTKIVPTLLG